jgi:hypothetical protein
MLCVLTDRALVEGFMLFILHGAAINSRDRHQEDFAAHNKGKHTVILLHNKKKNGKKWMTNED